VGGHAAEDIGGRGRTQARAACPRLTLLSSCPTALLNKIPVALLALNFFAVNPHFL
jgi:hypothetical protein